MKRILWLVVMSSIMISICVLVSCSNQQSVSIKELETNVVRFVEDYTVTCNVDKYVVLPYSFKDAKSITNKNIWITKSFLESKEHLDVISGFLENGYNILIQEYNFTAFDAYELFKIPNEKRAMKTSKEGELKDIQQPLQRFGAMLFKYKDVYYAVGINSINHGVIDDLLVVFTFDKGKMIGE